MVEFAIKLPGRGDSLDDVVWLPIDAKFPKEQYERMQGAQDTPRIPSRWTRRADLFRQIKLEAKTINPKNTSRRHTPPILP